MVPYRLRPAHGAAMASARRAAGMTQADMVAAGVATNTGRVSHIETGHRVPTREEWARYWRTVGAEAPAYLEVVDG